VTIRELSVPDCFEITPRIFFDDRGRFLEAFRGDELRAETGRSLNVAQANTSVSRRGAVRGIHFADVPPSQAKYVMVASGAIVDFVVDIRAGSPTFGQWDSVVLDSDDSRSVFVPEGVGHAFVALTDKTVVNYLVSAVFNAPAEHGITPLDPEIGLAYPAHSGELVLSDKDTAAPTLSESLSRGLLPIWSDCQALYATLRQGN
jgi:dTDP-4-dehydrorhamnose 3,5-epimerase